MASNIGAELRTKVARRADQRCEYCLISEADAGFSHQVDHIVSRKHAGSSTMENLAFACILCNRHKGSDIASIDPRTGEPVRFFHPRHGEWTDHFRLEGPVIAPISSCGAPTVRILRLNAHERIAERRLLQSMGRFPLD